MIGLIYAAIVRYTSFCIPCFFNTLTGFKCPGCGITHLILDSVSFRFYDAYCANRFLFTTSPLILCIVILNFFCKKEIRTAPFTRGLTLFYACSLVVWGVVRNIFHI